MSAAASAASSPSSNVGSAITKVVCRAKSREQMKRLRIDSMVSDPGVEGRQVNHREEVASQCEPQTL